jgi:hypothetical protein
MANTKPPTHFLNLKQMAAYVRWYKKFNAKQKTGFAIGLLMLAILPVTLFQVQRQVRLRSNASEAKLITTTDTPENQTPIVTTATLPIGYIGQNYSLSVQGLDKDEKDKLTITAFGLPSGFKVTNCQQFTNQSDENMLSCLITGTPSKAGQYRVYITIRDNNNASSQFRYQLIIK